ncbi:MAG: hypothetical protein IAE78_24150 [Myxococcus sp.]|nr:hypothetical protein [Myxococcus sp.]
MNLWAETATRLKRWEGLALVAVAVFCLGFQLKLPSATPSDADYQSAAAVIEQERQPGDVVLLAPWFIERARLFVPEQVPVVGYFGSDGDDLRQHRRIWVLANPALPRFSWSAFLEAFGRGRSEDGPERTFGPLALKRFTNGRARPLLFSAAQSLASARVYLEGPQGQQACTFSGRSWRCPNGGEVVEEWRELHFEPHRCLRFYPPGGPVKLVAEFSGVPATDTLQLITGYAWERGYYRNEGPSDFGVEVNGEPQVTTLPAGIEKVYRVDRQHTAAGTVRAWVQADNARNREICFELLGFGPEGT